MNVDLEKHNNSFLLLFSSLTIFFIAMGAYLTAHSTRIEYTLGYASYGAGIITLLADIYTGIVRLLKFRVQSFLKDVEGRVKKEIKDPIMSSIEKSWKTSNRMILTSAAISSNKSYKDVKESFRQILEEMEKDEKFWRKYGIY